MIQKLTEMQYFSSRTLFNFELMSNQPDEPLNPADDGGSCSVIKREGDVDFLLMGC
jgi:hypothetical protein